MKCNKIKKQQIMYSCEETGLTTNVLSVARIGSRAHIQKEKKMKKKGRRTCLSHNFPKILLIHVKKHIIIIFWMVIYYHDFCIKSKR